MVYFEGLFCNFVPKTFGNTVAAARRVYNFWYENPKDFNEFSLQTISKDFERYPKEPRKMPSKIRRHTGELFTTLLFSNAISVLIAV